MSTQPDLPRAGGGRALLKLLRAQRAQGMVEFALALPVLLLLIFGVIEFARILSAWLSVENGARFGIRYAVTGEYELSYCTAAGSALGLSADDLADGQVDCRVPAWVDDNENKESQLVDWVRLPSIRDTATEMALALSIDPAANEGEPHFFKVTVCSSRDADANGSPDFVLHEANTPEFRPARCTPSDDPGAPGDRVTVVVDFNHPLILPFISNIWPQIHLTSRRDGVVERFRTSRVINLPMDIVLPTFTPTVSPTPTASSTPTMTPTATPTPDCNLYTIGAFGIGNNAEVFTTLTNNAADNPNITRLVFNWDYAEDLADLRNFRNMYLDWMRVGASTVWGSGANDYNSSTDTQTDGSASWTGPIAFLAGTATTYRIDLDNQWTTPAFETEVIGEDFGLTMYLDNNCVITHQPVPRPLPLPNCDLYSMSNFNLLNNGVLQMSVSNGDQFSANLTKAIFSWDQVDNYFVSMGDNSLSTDWFSWNWNPLWGASDGDPRDYDSPTDTSVDAAYTWLGPKEFRTMQSYTFRLDLDKSSENPNNWLPLFGIVSSDFGIRFEYDNGCILERAAVPRPILTPTPDCDLIFPNRVRLSGDNFEIRVQNNNVASAYLIDSTLIWPTFWGMYFNYMKFRDTIYYDTVSSNSPVIAQPDPVIAHPGMTSQNWLSDFNNWPANPPVGYFSGALLYEFPGWGTCPVFGELAYTPPPTRTPTRTAAPTGIPTATVPVTITNTPSPTIEIKPTDTLTPTPRTPTVTPVEPTYPPVPTTPGATSTSTPVPPPSAIPSITPTFNMDG